MNIFLTTLCFFLISFVNFHQIVNCENDKKDWWKTMLFYNIFPRSFKDSDGDGIGDLNGITSKLDHLADLGVDAFWVNPIYKSPMIDLGYDISDHYTIDPSFGTLEDFDTMISRANELGIKVILDFVPNHTSDEHHWFQKSIKKEDPYTDYYVWKDPKEYDADGNRIPPNNWGSTFGGSAWEWNEERQQYYFHAFHKKQSDFNLRNPVVVDELKKIMKFWLDRGVFGFRLDAPKFMIEDKYFRDDHFNHDGYCLNDRSQNQPETYELVHEFREFLDKYSEEKDGITRIFVAEVYAETKHLMAYHDHDNQTYTHFPFNYYFKDYYHYPDSLSVNGNIRGWLNYMPKGSVPNWSTENHDNRRISNMFGDEITDFLNIITLTLPGVACVYYGQEIGMRNIKLAHENIKDVLGTWYTRDPERGPMQWDSSVNGGFTTGSKAWLPLSMDYWHRNVKFQKEKQISHYNVFKKISKLRKTPTFKNGDLKTYLLSQTSYVIKRFHEGEPTYIVAFNFARNSALLDLKDVFPDNCTLEVVIGSVNSGYSAGDVEPTKHGERVYKMTPRSIIVLKTKEKINQVKVRKNSNLIPSVKPMGAIVGGLLLLFSILGFFVVKIIS